jgi:hypothetical protein
MIQRQRPFASQSTTRREEAKNLADASESASDQASKKIAHQSRQACSSAATAPQALIKMLSAVPAFCLPDSVGVRIHGVGASSMRVMEEGALQLTRTIPSVKTTPQQWQQAEGLAAAGEKRRGDGTPQSTIGNKIHRHRVQSYDVIRCTSAARYICFVNGQSRRAG